MPPTTPADYSDPAGRSLSADTSHTSASPCVGHHIHAAKLAAWIRASRPISV